MSRVVIIVNYGPSLLLFRGSLIRELVKHGHEVVVVAPAMESHWGKQVLALGASVYAARMQRTGINPFADLALFFQFRRLMRRLRPSVVLSYTIKPAIWGTLAARSVRVPRIIAVITGLGFAFTEGRGLKRKIGHHFAVILYRFALRHASTVLFMNPDDLQLFRSWHLLHRARTAYAINGEGLDLIHFSLQPLPASVSFLMISRLLGDKGVREFAEAARTIKRQSPHIRFRIVGYLDQSPDSITQAELNDIVSSGVEFLGRLDDVRPAIAESSVCVLPSYREGMPRSVLEAMAMGRPVITTDTPGCRETVVDGVNGYLVPPRNAQALGAAMQKFITSPELVGRMGPESRRLAEEKFDVNRVNEEIMRHAGL